jgi:predicted nucleic acid-binding Zn ribbon protein
MRDKSHKDPHEPQGISTLLSGMARDQGWQLQLDRHSLFLHWNTLVDKSTCAHAQPLKIVGNVLWLEVANSAWMQQLQFQKIPLLETLNTTLRLSRLEDIRFTLVDHEKAKEQNKQKVRFMQPNPAAREAFEKQIAGIEDEKIRDSLMSLWYLSHSCQKC